DVLRQRIDVAQAQLRAVGNAVRALMLTDSPDTDSPCARLRDFLWGRLGYSRVEQDLVKAVIAIAGGEMWFSRRELAEMLRERADGVRNQARLQRLAELPSRRGPVPHATTVIVPFIVSWPDPQKMSHRNVNVPSLSGTRRSRATRPGMMSARAWKSGTLKPMMT